MRVLVHQQEVTTQEGRMQGGPEVERGFVRIRTKFKRRRRWGSLSGNGKKQGGPNTNTMPTKSHLLTMPKSVRSPANLRNDLPWYGGKGNKTFLKQLLERQALKDKCQKKRETNEEGITFP